MQFQSLSAWLGWLEQAHPSEIDLGLERIRRVAQYLQLLSPSACTITVAGTNGKGSCVAATACLLAAAGQRVGVYTSPHLLCYNERIQINGQMATDEDICFAFEAIYTACQALSLEDNKPLSLTYFEYGTLAALHIFRCYAVDTMVLEVGLGGRLDAINIIDADIAVITSIDIDHQDWLGDNRELIGFEKAGIMRAEHLAICADPLPPQSLLDHAQQIAAPLKLVTSDFGFSQTSSAWCWWSKSQTFTHQQLPQLPLPSLAAALYVAEHLGIELQAIDAFTRLAQLRVPGRFQTQLWGEREVILDVAHNPAATAYLAQRLAQSALVPGAKTYAIVAMMADKDREASLRNLLPEVDYWCLADLTEIPRAASLSHLQADLNHLGQVVSHQGDLAQCLAWILSVSQVGDRIIICGSFYTVAAGLKALV